MSKLTFKNIFNKTSYTKKNLLTHIIKRNEKELTENEKIMIINIIELNEFSVKDIMVPRIDVVSIELESNLKDITKIINQKGYSRLPVYKDNIDNIIGILHSKDLLKYLSKENSFNLEKIMREPLFVPESKPISDLLIELRNKKIHLAIVVDEYGGMSGIVCLEDILEKIVGEIQDEFDNEIEDIQKIDDNTFLINSRTNLSEINEKIGTNFDENDIDTLTGLIFMVSGKIPTINEKISYKNYLFTIESISGRQIKTIKLEIQNNTENIKDKEL